MRRLLALPLALACARPASAHGPCGCTEPVVAERGRELVTSPGYLVVWNPDARWFGGAAGPPSLASAHRAGAPSRLVLLRERPPYPRSPPRARFRVPRDAPPGVYLVLVFDGSEGGAHATWDYVHVLDRAGDAAPAATNGGMHPLVRAVVEAFPRF